MKTEIRELKSEIASLRKSLSKLWDMLSCEIGGKHSFAAKQCFQISERYEFFCVKCGACYHRKAGNLTDKELEILKAMDLLTEK